MKLKWVNSQLSASTRLPNHLQQSDIVCMLCSIWRNSVPCVDDFTLLERKDSAQMTIMGYQGCGIPSGVFQEGTEVRSQLSEKDLSQKELSEHPGSNVTPMQETGGPQTPPRRPRHI